MTDMTQLAIDTLVNCGTDRGLALAAEIDRGRNRVPPRPQSDAEREAARQDHGRRQAAMLEQLRPAQPWEWAQWVSAFLKDGGSPNLLRTYPHQMALQRFYVAESDVTVLPLYGALALNIITPLGVSEDGGDTGHTSLYGYSKSGVTYRGFHNITRPYFVPVFSDTDITDAGQG